MIARRTVLLAGGAATLPRIAIGQSMPELQTMRSTSKAWLWLAEDYARDGGFFEKAGVRVVSNASNRGTNIASLAGSGVDIVLGDPGEAINARGQGFGVRTFLQTVARYASHIVVKKDILDRAGITEASPVEAKAAVLKGLRLGTTGPGAAPDNLFRWMAKRAGLDSNKDMRLVGIQGGGPGMIAGLQQGVIDGFCLSSPTADLAVSRAGCAYLFDMAANPPPEFNPFCYIVASTAERTLASKRDALLRYATGITLTLRSIAAEPDRFRAFAVPYLELDPAIAERAFASNGRIYFTDPVPNDALFRRNLDFMNVSRAAQGEDPLPKDLVFTSLFDPSIATEAVKRLG